MTRKTVDELLKEAGSRLDRLEPEDALAAQRDGALLIDTRSSDERRRTGVIPGAVHIPLSVLPWRVDPAGDPAYRNPHIAGLDQRLVVVCAHGFSSLLAAATLQDLGFSQATDVIGGFEAWQERDLPVHPAIDANYGTVLPGMGQPDA